MKKLLFVLILLAALPGNTLHAVVTREIKLAALAKPGSPQRIVAEKFKELSLLQKSESQIPDEQISVPRQLD